jgi:hypothetical protein
VRERPQRVPGRRGHRGGVLTPAADVADRDSPSVAGRVDVVEVRAHLGVCAGRHVRRGHLRARHLPHPPGQQAGLQCVGDLGALAVQAVDPDRQGQVLAEFLDQPDVSHVEVPLASLRGQGEHSVAAFPVRQRDAYQRG